MCSYTFLFLFLILIKSYKACTNHTELYEIFCAGDILHHVQMSEVLGPDKLFVKSSLKFYPSEVKNNFYKLLNDTSDTPSKEEMKLYIEENFDFTHKDYDIWTPTDWVKSPRYIDDIYDYNLKTWSKEINSYWKQLGRKVNEDVLVNNSLYSMIYVPHPFIVPGGKFTEFYYWDSYWIIEGLLISEMYETSKNMIKNYLFLVDKFNFVPNGGRIYYLERSQPPFLIPMFNLYLEFRIDLEFLNESINLLEKEFSFWDKHRSVQIIRDKITYKVFQYKVKSQTPRPESYYRDFSNAQNLSEKERKIFYAETKAGAESGWDFSSRWFLSEDGYRTVNITDIHTSHIAPVCLNSLMTYNAKLLSKFYNLLGRKDKSEEYNLYAQNMNKTISRLFWNEDEGIWLDYNIKLNRSQSGFYLSNFVPLWTETFGIERDVNYIADSVIKYIDKINFDLYPGGVPTSLNSTGQQWDFPNGWAPLQYFIVLGLKKLGEKLKKSKNFETGKIALDLALKLAEKWTVNNYEAYIISQPHSMFEKYDVTQIGTPGGGGEYATQIGFGWTNGVVIKFLSMYPHSIRIAHIFDPAPYIIVTLLSFIICVFCVAYLQRLRFSRDNNAACREHLLKKTESTS